MLGSDLLAEGIVAAALFTTRSSRSTPSCGDGGDKTRQQLLPAAKQQSPLGLEPPSLSSTSSDGGRRLRADEAAAPSSSEAAVSSWP
nr:hypothetical protein Itr_chr11CG06180 [Ipomoea trifida]